MYSRPPPRRNFDAQDSAASSALSAAPSAPQGIPTDRKRHRVALLDEPVSRTMYQLMIAQLYHDGFTDAADAVAWSTGCTVVDIERRGPKLERLVANGLSVEATHATDLRQFKTTEVVEKYLSRALLRIPTHMNATQLKSHLAVGNMKERFVSSSLGGVIRSCTFSPTGSMVLIGGSNKVGARLYCLETILGASNASDLRTSNTLHTIAEGTGASGTSSQGPSGAINASAATLLGEARLFSKHRLSVETARFHPTEPLAVTGGREGDVYVWSYREPTGVDEPTSILQDTFPIRSLDISPVGGDYALIGTDHSAVRLANIETGKAMIPAGLPSDGTQPTAGSAHTAAISEVAFRGDGRMFATASFDGSIGIHDLVSGKTVLQLSKAHGSVPVTSVVYSRTGNILLSYGMDAVARLWDLRRLQERRTSSGVSYGSSSVVATSRTSPYGGEEHSTSAPLPSYDVAVQSFGIPSKCEHRIKARFNSHESLIVAQDSSLCAVQSFDVYSGEVVYSCAVAQHAQRAFALSPYDPMLVSGGDDCRLRLWTVSTLA
jgi:cleavage stimulation factor subunit 1